MPEGELKAETPKYTYDKPTEAYRPGVGTW